MAKITLKGNEVNTIGDLPAVGSVAPDATVVKSDLSELNIHSIDTQYKILNIFPSIDTGTCATSVREFNKRATELSDVTVVNLSADLPFAQGRFCGAEGIEKAETASTFRSDLAQSYNVEIADGALKGLCSRAVVVLDGDNKVVYSEQVPEIVDEPNYDAAISSISN